MNGHLCCHEKNVNETLGLVASRKRRLQNGLQYESLFPKAEVGEIIVVDDGTVKDTVKEIEKLVDKYNWQTAKLSPLLKRNTLPETLDAVWTFFYNHYQYKLDRPEVEELRTPARAWYDRKTGIDCDCYSISVSSVLTNLGIKHKFRITKYGAGWQHIYIIVPVPNSIKSEYWVIDCVLDRFNYEKTYTDKFDYTMDTLGIPIAVLNGTENDTELHAILSGVDFDQAGFGATSTLQDDLGALHRHLRRTHRYIRRNPHSVIYQGGAHNNLRMFEHALKNWHDPVRRTNALNGLAQAEHELNVSMGLAGIDDYNPDDEDDAISEADDDDYDEVNSLGKVKGKRKFWNAVKNAHKKIVKFHKKIGKKIWDAHKKVFKALVRFNPLTLAVRGAILLVLKTNMFQMARALYPAFVPESESRRYGYTADQITKAKSAKHDVERIFVKILQGKPSALAKQIIQGATHKRKALSGIDGDDNLGSAVAAGASLVAASAPLIKIAKVLAKVGLKDGKGMSFVQKIVAYFKKRKAKKQAEGDTSEAGASDSGTNSNSTSSDTSGGGSTESNDNSANESRKSSSSSSASGSSGDGNSENSDDNKSVDGRPDKPAKEDNSADDTNTADDKKTAEKGVQTTEKAIEKTTTDASEDGFFAKVGTWAKENPMATTAIGVTVASALVLAFSPKARTAVGRLFGGKKKGALSGTKKKNKNLKGNYSKKPKRYNYQTLRA